MNKLMGAVCALAILAGCASRPGSGPGSGRGDTYVPLVEPRAVAADVYDADVAACQKTAQSFTFVPPDEHSDALFVLDVLAFGAAGAATAAATAPDVAAGLVAGASAEGVTWGLMNGFEYWVYSPWRAGMYRRQETAIANCMARKGYVNADPSVTVTWLPRSVAGDGALRRIGRDTYTAEQFAKQQRCAALPMASLVGQGPGYERFSVPCDGGRTLAVRCVFGHCQAG